MNTLALIINTEDAAKAGMVQDFNSRIPAGHIKLVRNDVTGISLRVVQPATTAGQVWDDVDLSGSSVVLGIGEYDRVPTSGGFTLTYGANTTSTLAYDATAVEVSIALNSLASVVSAGGLTVISGGQGVFLITFLVAGVRTLIINNTNTLNPASQVIVSRVITGDGGTAEMQVMRLVASLYAQCTSWAAFPGAGAVVTQLAPGSGSTNNVQSVALTPAPYAGSFQITTALLTTSALAYNATAAQVQAALNTGGNNYVVVGNAGGPWTITAVATGIGTAYQVTTAGLIVPTGLTGTLTLSTLPLMERFASGTEDEITLVLEVQVTTGGDVATILQVPVLVSKDVIDFASLAPIPIADNYALRAQTVYSSPLVTSLATLAALPTVPGTAGAQAVGTLCAFVAGTGSASTLSIWQLQASTAATGSSVQRPADYDGATNQLVWFQVF
jgi:hypothetical protein